MTNLLERLAFALVAMDLTPSELAYLEDSLRALPVGALRSIVQATRRPLDLAQADSPQHGVARSSHLTVGDRVERLLKIDARLSTSNAVETFSRALVQEGLILDADIPPLSKKAFNTWVDRISTIVEPKELLRVATVIRNKFAHDRITDWSSIER